MPLAAISIELFVADGAAYAPLMAALGLTARRVSGAVVLWEGAATVILHEAAADLAASHPFAGQLAAGTPRGVGVEICLETDDLDAVFAAVRGMAGFTVAAEPVRQPWGLRDFRALTPDGYYLRVTEPRARPSLDNSVAKSK